VAHAESKCAAAGEAAAVGFPGAGTQQLVASQGGPMVLSAAVAET